MSYRDLLLTFVINISWAFNFVAGKYGLEHFTPFLFTTLRFALVLILLAPLLQIMTVYRAGLLKHLILIGLVLGVGHFSFMFWSMAVSHDISSIAIASQLYVPFSTLLGVFLLGEKIGWRRILGLTVAFAGVLLIGFDPAVLNNITGLLLVTCAAIAMALGNLLISQLKGRIKPLAIQAWVALVAAPGLFCLSLLFEHSQWQLIGSASWSQWSAVAYSSIGASLVGHGVLAYLLGRYPISTVTPFMLLMPVFAVFFGVWLWGDQLTWQLVVGGMMTLIGVAIIMLRTVRKQEQPA